ncbi:SRPBCC family protein [Actinospica robiniae]|uniref:SRPBCC family protein n=1 Tax=Actinospica robiniae TaxID=304901 RepID=UPI00041BC465|nr:SRPBCC family protein [Actinospica robiniae]
MPIRTVYDQWSELQEFGTFTKGVQGVDKKDDVTTSWRAKIMWSNRSWTATVQEQIPDDRIRWTSEGAKGSTEGVVTFHELAPSLTRIVVVVEYTPSGFFEKTGNIWRAQGRRLRLDLKHFARQVTLHADEDLEGWRGEIRDGEVVRSHEEGLEDDERPEDEEYEDEYDEGAEEPEDDYEDEDDEDEYDEEEDEEDEDDDEEDAEGDEEEDDRR